MADQFTGMSIREGRAMPALHDATLLQLGILPRTEGPSIAREQEKYVYAVLDRCPRWRWLKKRRLTEAAIYATRVREANETYNAPKGENLGRS